jgi:hypothetical protein
LLADNAEGRLDDVGCTEFLFRHKFIPNNGCYITTVI